jgi:hypothetical protein
MREPPESVTGTVLSARPDIGWYPEVSVLAEKKLSDFRLPYKNQRKAIRPAPTAPHGSLYAAVKILALEFDGNART